MKVEKKKAPTIAHQLTCMVVAVLKLALGLWLLPFYSSSPDVKSSGGREAFKIKEFILL
jgi:hypothetical protein